MSEQDVAPREFHGPSERIRKGLIIIYTGNGKGKSTAAFGAALRSLGRGFRVAIVQFIKGKWISGELKALEKFGPQVEVHAVGEGFTWDTKNLERDKRSAEKGWALCVALLREKKFDVYIFDEICYVLSYRFLDLSTVMHAP